MQSAAASTTSGEQSSAEASRDSGHVTKDKVIGLVQWHQQSSHSLPPPPPAPPFTPSQWFFFPLLSSASPCQWWRVTVQHSGPNAHAQRTPSPQLAAYCFAVFCHRVLQLLPLLSSPPPSQPPVRVSGSKALVGGGNQHRALPRGKLKQN